MQTKRQSEIIESALEIIYTNGIQGFTMKNLAKKIGISEPAIYRHFESKIEILLSILKNFKELAEMLSGLMETYEGTAIEKIRFIFTKLIEIFTETPSMLSVIFSEEIFKNEEILKAKIFEILNIHTQTIEDILLKGQEEKNVRTDIDKKSLTLIAMGSFRLLVKKWDIKNNDSDLKIEGEKLITVINKIIEIQTK